MTQRTVKIYTQPGCGACMNAKEYLKSKGVAFEELDITTSDSAFEELTQKYQGRGTPTIVIGEVVIQGFNRDRLEEALAA